MYLNYPTDAIIFGLNLYEKFHRNYDYDKKIMFPDEINQFQALIKSFMQCPKTYASSYHGNVSHVEFNQQFHIEPNQQPLTLTRASPKCELADVLIVTYTPSELRITFLQAKSVRSHKIYPLHLDNVEQYALLAKRPLITKWPKKIVWNNNVLSDAKLKSVGSFGVFHPCSSGGVGFEYISADMLNPIKLSLPVGKKRIHGNLDLGKGTRYIRGKHPFRERTRCFCLIDFGAALFNLEIGSPIDATLNNSYSTQAKIALSSLLKNEIKKPDLENKAVITELLESDHFKDLKEIPDENGISGTSSLIVLKGNSDKSSRK